MEAQTVDLSDVTEKFVRNMKILETLTPEANVREQMSVVRGQAEDLGKFFRAKGTASKRRKLSEEREEIRSKPRISERDRENIKELEAEIRELDPENIFGHGRNVFSQSSRDLLKELDFIQTNDPVRQDILRLIRQHISVYSKALQEY